MAKARASVGGHRSGLLWPVAVLSTLVVVVMANAQSTVRSHHQLTPLHPSSVLSPFLFQKYSLTPSSSIVGTNAASVVAPTEQLLSYVPAPTLLASAAAAAGGGVSPLPLVNAFKSIADANAALAASSLTASSSVPVTFK